MQLKNRELFTLCQNIIALSAHNQGPHCIHTGIKARPHCRILQTA